MLESIEVSGLGGVGGFVHQQNTEWLTFPGLIFTVRPKHDFYLLEISSTAVYIHQPKLYYVQPNC